MAAITYNPNTTAEQFHADNSFFRLLFGPVRCGKSVANCQEVFIRAAAQMAANNGVRYARAAIIRNTYPQLKSTTIKTWTHWFPEEHLGKIKYDSPISHHIKFRGIDLEVLFLAIESENDLGKLKSLELTYAYINELQYLPRIVLNTCLERINSYPHKNTGAKITFGGVFADTNPPSTRHWLYKMENNLPDNFKVFHYAPAVKRVTSIPSNAAHAVSRDGTIYINNPDADYIENLPDKRYYLNLIPALSDEEVKVSCEGNYGFTRSGKPVYTDYNDLMNFVPHSIAYDPEETLVLGWDFGLTPACVLLQMQRDGRIAQIFEFTSEDMGIEKLAIDYVIPTLHRRFKGWERDYKSFADPAGNQGNQVTYTKRTPIQALNQLGIRTQAARTNDLDIRIGAVSYFLRKSHGGKGAFIISKDCQITREGMLGDYQFENIKLSTNEIYLKEKPLKNSASHPCEAQQYGMLYFHDLARRELRPETVSISTSIY